MNQVVVFGATGAVGAYTCLYLKEKGYNVVATARRVSDNGFFQDYGISYYSVDITKRESFAVLPQKEVSAIVNLSGMLPARMKGYDPQKYVDINFSGSINILEYAILCKSSRVVFSQSIADVAHLCGSKNPIAADAQSKFPLDNDHSVYSITKTASCNLLVHYAARHCFSYFILRFPNIYLWHPNPKYYVDGIEQWSGYRLMIDKAMKGEPLAVWGDPLKVRDIVYVKDCCQIIEKCISVENPVCGIYNVGTGVGTTMEDQVRGIVEVFSPKDRPSIIS